MTEIQDCFKTIYYKKQKTFYFDDTLIKENIKLKEIPKVSEMTPYFEEINSFFKNKMYSKNLKIDYNKKFYDIKKIPNIINTDNNIIKLKLTKTNANPNNKNIVELKMSIAIDLTRSFSEILQEIRLLEFYNDSFLFEDFLRDLDLEDEKDFHTYLMATKMDLLEYEEDVFILIKYYNLRKKFKLDKKSSIAVIKKIFEEDLILS